MIATGLMNVGVVFEVGGGDNEGGGVLGKTATGLWIGVCGSGIGKAFCGSGDRSDGGSGGVRGDIRCRAWPPNLAAREAVRVRDPIVVDCGRGPVDDRAFVSFSSSSLFLSLPVVFLPIAMIASEWSGSALSSSSSEMVRTMAWYLVP